MRRTQLLQEIRKMELTRFRGHLTLLGGGIHDAAIKTTVSTGVS